MSAAAPRAPFLRRAAPRPRPASRPGTRLPLATALAAAVAVSLVRPLAWGVGLAGFLAGGGLVVLTWPILVLPTPTGLQNALGGPVSTLVFGAPSSGMLALIAGLLLLGASVLVAAVLVGAWAERVGIRLALDGAREEGLAVRALPAGAPGTGRVALVRLLSLAPLAVAAGLAWRPIYDSTYRELILPDDLLTPLPLRVLGELPELVIALGAVWLVSDAAAAAGVRRLVLQRRPVAVAWLLGWADLLRRPHRLLPSAAAGAAILGGVLAPVLLAVGVGWTRVRDILGEGREPLLVLVAVLAWVAVWLGGLVLAGVGAAIRAAAWTLEAVEIERRRDPDGGLPPGDGGLPPGDGGLRAVAGAAAGVDAAGRERGGPSPP